jgi:Ca2+-binding RTX toxin-like protein
LLSGRTGNDTLSGGAGNDRLVSGEGYDNFIFNTALDATTNVDKLSDFNPWADRISLKSAIFKGIGGRGALKDAAFWTGSKAHDASDRIIYNKKTGELYFDQDGSGSAHHQIKFATIGKMDLSAAAFWVL